MMKPSIEEREAIISAWNEHKPVEILITASGGKNEYWHEYTSDRFDNLPLSYESGHPTGWQIGNEYFYYGMRLPGKK